MPLSFDDSQALPFAEAAATEAKKQAALAARQVLLSGKGPGSEFTGWIDLPVSFDREEYARLQAAAARIRENSDILVVVGIGGSYLGARAAIELLSSPFAGSLSREKRRAPLIVYAGNQLSTAYLRSLLELLQDRDFSVNVISKSGTTTEPAIAFRILKELLEQRYGREGAARRIYATTDRSRGALKKLAEEAGYETFVVPDDIGGRFSVLTAVGLLPIAAAGIDTDALLAGAAAERERCLTADYEENPALRYAALRHVLMDTGRSVELLANYEPGLHYVGEWWKQLFGESEGKQGKGLFPAAVDLTTDLHSMGQYIQDGRRILFETVLAVEEDPAPLLLTAEPGDPDGLNYLAGKPLSFVNEAARRGTALAHTDGSCPNCIISLPRMDADSLGRLFYFFEFACGVSGTMLGVNPFDQPGVESYKANMFALLGKPGYEAAGQALLKRL